MATTFKTLKWKNFLSTGDNFTSIDFLKNPITLITGSNGAGKCVRGNTLINVIFKKDDLKFKYFGGRNTTTVKDIVDFYTEYPEHIGEIQVETRFGFKTIEYADCTAVNSTVHHITTQTGRELFVSPDHLLFSSRWEKTKHLQPGTKLLTDTGYETIKSNRVLDTKEDLYDLQVAEVKEYYANGFVSHNSTLIDAIAFVLFGKPHRNINKPQLVNSINGKDLLVEITFSVGKKDFRVVRGMKPNIFEIYENNKLLNQDAKTRDYQSYLETNILKFNYKSFHQIVVLGSSSFVPFMQLPSAGRREIIENLLDINIFTKMNVLLKEKIQAVREHIRTNDYEIDLAKEKQKLKSNHLIEIETIAKNKQKKTHKELQELEKNTNALIEKKKQDSLALTIRRDKYAKDIKKNEKLIKQLNKFQIQIEGKINQARKTIGFFQDNDVCPTCSQSIPEDSKREHQEKCNATIKKLDSGQKDLQKELDEKSRMLTELHSGLDGIMEEFNQIIKIDNTISSNQHKIKTLSESLTAPDDVNNSIKKLKNEYRELEKELKELSENAIKLKYDYSEYQLIGDLLKDSGIKSKIIRQYIPLINKYINYYLEILEFFVTFEFDEFFNEKILSRHRDDFTYSSFSEGEKSRIDLALLFAWREIARKKNSVTTNLLILDEVMDGSLDGDGLENLQTILGLSRNQTNTFIISHKKELIASEKFDAKIEFVKNGNFSEMV